jgi:hypothetical protein
VLNLEAAALKVPLEYPQLSQQVLGPHPRPDRKQPAIRIIIEPQMNSKVTMPLHARAIALKSRVQSKGNHFQGKT